MNIQHCKAATNPWTKPTLSGYSLLVTKYSSAAFYH